MINRKANPEDVASFQGRTHFMIKEYAVNGGDENLSVFLGSASGTDELQFWSGQDANEKKNKNKIWLKKNIHASFRGLKL